VVKRKKRDEIRSRR